MKLIETGSFPLAEIEIGERLRNVDDDWAKGLAATIDATGLQNPVQLLKIGNKFRLVAGAHRVRAFQMLDRSDIPAAIYEPETDKPELELRESEIIENIGRRDLSALDRAAHIAELAAIQKSLEGERRGGDRKSEKSKAQQLRFWSLSDEVASKMGLSSRTIEADLELYRGLSAATRKRVAGSWLADARNQLRDLAKLDADMQKAALDLILAEEPKARKVYDAVCIIEKRPKAEKDTQAELIERVDKAWWGMDGRTKKQMLLKLRDYGVIITADQVVTGARARPKG